MRTYVSLLDGFAYDYSQAYADIDLGQFLQNYRIVSDFAKGKRKSYQIISVLKADGYGHGIVGLLEAYRKIKGAYLGVATVDEALEVKRVNQSFRVITLGFVPIEGLSEAAKNDVTITLYSKWLIPHLSEYARVLNRPIRVHIKVDTGLTRLGVVMDELPEILDTLRTEKGVYVEGLFTHLSAGGDPRDECNADQIVRFNECVVLASRVLPGIKYFHIANSGGLLNFPEMRSNSARLGILLYGYHPSQQVKKLLSVKPILSLKARIINVRRVEKGVGISYSHRYSPKDKTTIITIPLGYADGIPRTLTGIKSRGGSRTARKEIAKLRIHDAPFVTGHLPGGDVLFRSRRVPIAGEVCMDYFMVDVGDLRDVKVGEEVTLIGRDGKEEITAEEVAARAGTSVYDVLCGLARKRILRRYFF